MPGLLSRPSLLVLELCEPVLYYVDRCFGGFWIAQRLRYDKPLPVG